ncbi:unnamed protein product [Phytomonas sp. EM1]|nr:unnamed protein product [Phytomonas sp. EM1]|eukprot:CCW63057.1 unnamed protein product [Phytomonas sp. isolate EM1]
MVGILNSIVFQPINKESDILFTYLCRAKRYMSYVLTQSGECIYYIHIQHHPRRESYDSVSVRTGSIARSSSENSSEANMGSSPPEQNNFIIIYSHGNAENLGICHTILRWLSFALHVDVIGYDYRGYGFSGNPRLKTPFEPTESSVYVDADCIYEEVLALGYHPSQIILMGRSLGGGPACYLAEKHHQSIAGLILESTFTSCIRVVSTIILPFCFGWLDMFVNMGRIKNITDCPILFMHGKKDSIVPIRCSEQLLSIALKQRQSLRKEQMQKKRSFLSCLSCNSVGVLNPGLQQRKQRVFSVKSNNDQSADVYRKGIKVGDEADAFNNTANTPKVADLRPPPLNLTEAHSLEASRAGGPLRAAAPQGDGVGPVGGVPLGKSSDKPSPLYKGVDMRSSRPPTPEWADPTAGSCGQTNAGTSAVTSAAGRGFTVGAAFPQHPDGSHEPPLDPSRSAIAETTEEKLGIYHHWFEDCGHNDIETRSGEQFIFTLKRFIKRVEELKKLKRGAQDEAPPFTQTSKIG